LRFRNASDSQLSLRAKQQSEETPPVPRRNSSLYCWLRRCLANQCQLSTRNHNYRSYKRVQWAKEEDLSD
jgi:hypothetical protein